MNERHAIIFYILSTEIDKAKPVITSSCSIEIAMGTHTLELDCGMRLLVLVDNLNVQNNISDITITSCSMRESIHRTPAERHP
jgi:hypothetical protein